MTWGLLNTCDSNMSKHFIHLLWFRFYMQTLKLYSLFGVKWDKKCGTGGQKGINLEYEILEFWVYLTLHNVFIL